MKVSEQWLREWAPVSVGSEELRRQLTDAGFTVDGAEPVTSGVSDVVVGHIVAVRPHPDADRLVVCDVNAGATEPAQVVCGAPNAAPGLRAPLARPGARLADGTVVRDARLRGVDSEGMLCSAAELGLGTDADGLLELDDTHAPGEDLRAALGLDDVVLDIDLTPNRGDALSVRGLAREIGVINDAPMTAPGIAPVPAASDVEFPIRLDNPEGCPRYLGRVIEGVDLTRASPLWMRERLRRSGLRSIDPVVDVTNYVMLELGQPMHAFDWRRLRGGIVVRDAEEGETITLIDGSEAKLDPSVLVIADAEGAVAMAGVMGGARTAVGEDTTDVFLECAFFAPMAVMGTARRHGMHTDAAQRYERGVDFRLQHDAVERATALLLDIVGGTPGPLTDATSEAHLPAQNRVTLRRKRLDLLVGEAVPPEVPLGIFERLGFAPRVEGQGEDLAWSVTAPSHRFDIALEEDLVEEVLRLYGYNTVESHPPTLAQPLGQATRRRLPTASIANLLVNLGYCEAITYSFIDPAHAQIFQPSGTPVRVVNAVSSEHSVMRASLLPGLVGALSNNLARRAPRVRLFEIGRCFSPRDAGEDQTVFCAGVAFGAREEESWTEDGSGVDFFDIKGDVERLLAPGGYRTSFVPDDDPALHPGQRARVILDGKPVGRFGRLHPEAERALDLPGAVFVFELALEALLGRRPRRNVGVSRFPSVRRDLALLLPRDVAAARVEKLARETLGERLSDFRLFDVYLGEGIDSNEKSLAVGLTFQDPSRTLEDAEVSADVDRVVAAMASELGARLR